MADGRTRISNWASGAAGTILLWLFFFWILIPISIWRSSASRNVKIALTALFLVVLAGAAVASGDKSSDFDPASQLASNEDSGNTADTRTVGDAGSSESSGNQGRPGQKGSRHDSKDDKNQTEERNARRVTDNGLPRGPLVFVDRVIDGDTIEVKLRGALVDVRLLGVDTPETVHPTVSTECFGPRASAFTTSALENERVSLTFDAERRDHYGRLLAYVWEDGNLFNRTLVARGLAEVLIYEPNDRFEGRLLAAEEAARRNDVGLWGACAHGGEASSRGGGSAGSSSSGGTSAGSVAAGDNCTSGYSPCLPPAPDYDCAGGSGDGPKYSQGPIKVTGNDPYELDSDGDGVACEA